MLIYLRFVRTSVFWYESVSNNVRNIWKKTIESMTLPRNRNIVGKHVMSEEVHLYIHMYMYNNLVLQDRALRYSFTPVGA